MKTISNKKGVATLAVLLMMGSAFIMAYIDFVNNTPQANWDYVIAISFIVLCALHTRWENREPEDDERDE